MQNSTPRCPSGTAGVVDVEFSYLGGADVASVVVARNGVAVLSPGRVGRPHRVPFHCDGSPQRYEVYGVDAGGLRGPSVEVVASAAPWFDYVLPPIANCAADMSATLVLSVPYRAFGASRVTWKIGGAAERFDAPLGDPLQITYQCADAQRTYVIDLFSPFGEQATSFVVYRTP